MTREAATRIAAFAAAVVLVLAVAYAVGRAVGPQVAPAPSPAEHGTGHVMSGMPGMAGPGSLSLRDVAPGLTPVTESASAAMRDRDIRYGEA